MPDYVRAAVSDDRRRCAARSASTSRAIRFRSVRPRTTSWAASTPTSGARTSLPGLFAAGEVGVHRRPRREPAGEQLAARGARVRRARRRRDAGAAAARAAAERIALMAQGSALGHRAPSARASSRPAVQPGPRRRPRSDVARGRPVPHPRAARGGRRDARRSVRRRSAHDRARRPTTRTRGAASTW